MQKEDAKKLLELMEKDEGLKTRIKAAFSQIRQGTFDGGAVDKVFAEEILPLAKEKGLDITLPDLVSYGRRKLTDAELEAATGGQRDTDGHWLTTVGYSCELWQESLSSWYGAKYTCGSCFNWFKDDPIMICKYLGFPGRCKLRDD